MGVAHLDWTAIAESLNEDGFARTGPVLDAAACQGLRRLYEDEALFRKRIVMARHGYGSGEYQYFANPLPEVVQALRETAYPFLADVANQWWSALGLPADFPADHAAFLEKCHGAGQQRPTPLLLKYGAGDYNRLHQDLYGEVYFPLQFVILLSAPGRDFEGGEFILTEQRPRMQSKAEAVPLGLGEGVVFATSLRPVPSKRGFARAAMRHGVSRLRSGARMTLGIPFHDAG